jgi:hypothetical protein
MFIDILLNMFSSVILAIAKVLPTFSIWPAIVTNGIRDFCGYIMKLNWIFPADSFLHALGFFIEFVGWYFFAKLIIWFFNWARGADGVKI